MAFRVERSPFGLGGVPPGYYFPSIVTYGAIGLLAFAFGCYILDKGHNKSRDYLMDDMSKLRTIMNDLGYELEDTKEKLKIWNDDSLDEDET